METLRSFLDREPDYAEIAGMRRQNAIPAWDSPHPHGFRVLSGKGATLTGQVLGPDGEPVTVEVDDAHGEIVCNPFGYGNEEIEESRTLVRERRGLDVVSANFTSDIIEWARASIAETLGPDYAIIFVGTGSEANDLACRVGFAAGGGQAEFNAAKGKAPFEVSIDGEGLMQAIVLPNAAKTAAVLRRAPHHGWIPGKGGFRGERLRIAPPLNVNADFIHGLVEKAIDTLRDPEVEAA